MRFSNTFRNGFFLEKNFRKLPKKKIINLDSGKSLDDLIRKNIKDK